MLRSVLSDRSKARCSSIMNNRIVALTESHFEPLRQVLDQVARERRYLALTQAPPPQQAHAFYRGLLADGQCHVAIRDGHLVGWCDVSPQAGEARRHVGTLGMGLLREARHQGIGTQLMSEAIATAWRRGLTRIELTVRVDNLNAKALYERMGFDMEGVKKHSMRVDGQYHDCFSMALLRADEREHASAYVLANEPPNAGG
jgi:putative acetyltransferase